MARTPDSTMSPMRRTSWAWLPPSKRSVMRMNSVCLRFLDELFAIADRFVDVGAAAELHAEEHVHGIVAALFGEIDDFGIEGDDMRIECGKAGEDRAADRAIDDGRRH